MNKKILSGILAAILAVSCLASCGSGDDSDTSSSGDSDTLVYAQGADPRGLDPQIVDDGESAKVTN